MQFLFNYQKRIISKFIFYFWLFVTGLSLIIGLAIASVNAENRLSEQSKVSIYGIGSVRAGMTLDEASRAAGTTLIKRISGGEKWGCFYYKPEGGPQGVSFMVINEKIARVDVSNKKITTIKGAKVGDTEEKIYSIYPGKIQVTNSGSGHFLTLIPTAQKDKNYRLVFQTRNNIVLYFRGGQLPEVEYIEGCV